MLDLGDAVVACFQRYLIDVLEHPNAFLHPTHALDYMNVVQSWTRNYDNPHQVKAIFMSARFMNDTIRSNAIDPRDPKFTLEPRCKHRTWADGIAIDRLLPVLNQPILVQEAPRACALVDSYLGRTNKRQALLDTITYAACHWQNDPHAMRNGSASLGEFRHNQLRAATTSFEVTSSTSRATSSLHQLTTVTTSSLITSIRPKRDAPSWAVIRTGCLSTGVSATPRP